MVAPSFQSFEVVSEIFVKNSKPYIKVRNPRTLTIREVRFYSEDEYRHLYLKEPKSTTPESLDKDVVWEFYKNEPINPNLKSIFEFDIAPVRIYRSQIPGARFHTGLGWYLVGSEPANDLPHVEITWEEFADGGRSRKPSILAALVKKKWEMIK